MPEIALSPEVADLRVSRGTDWQGGWIRLNGTFTPGLRYEARLPGTILSRSGEVLGETLRTTFEIPDYAPTIRFAQDGGVLSPKGNLLVDFTAVNVEKIRLDAYRVHANNLTTHLHGLSSRITSRSLLEDHVIPMKGRRNVPETSALDLKALLGNRMGIYSLRARAGQRSWPSSRALVVVTDLGVTVKRDRDGILTWITSLRTGRSVGGAEVEVITYNNQVLARGCTDGDGLVRLKLPESVSPGRRSDEERGHPDGDAWALLVRCEEDVNFLKLSDGAWRIEDVDTSGRVLTEAYDAFLYTDRDVYRPGERVCVTGILRTPEGETPPPFPLELRVFRPDGKRILQETLKPQAGFQGLVQSAFTSWAEGQTGRYRLTLSLPGTERSLGETSVFIEPFEPVRIEVTAEAERTLYQKDDEVAVRVRARYLFGQPASGLNAQVYGRLYGKNFESAQCPEFRFGDVDSMASSYIPLAEATLDHEGAARIAVAPDEPMIPGPSIPGLWAGRLTATVTESGGRSVSRGVDFSVDTAGRHVGLRLPDGNRVLAGTQQGLEWVVRTGEDAPADPGDLEFVIERIEWDSWLQEVNGEYVWRSESRNVELHREILLAAEGAQDAGSLVFNCPEAGRHRIVAKDLTTGSRSVLSFLVADGGHRPGRLSLERPERLELELDRKAYRPGDVAKLMLRSPFSGSVLLTVETDRVIHREVFVMKGDQARVWVPVDETIRGGAFVTASVVRPVDPDAESWLPHRAVGLIRLNTDHENQRLPLMLDAEAKGAPGRDYDIVVTTGELTGRDDSDTGRDDSDGGTVLHLWAVDEGILLTTGYRAPDPLAHFLAPRKLGVRSSDRFGSLLPEYRRPVSMARIGAGDGPDGRAAARRRGGSRLDTRAAPIIWRDAVRLDSNGTWKGTVTLPEHHGALRFMAVALDGDRYGRAEQRVELSAPLMVEASWPRFAAPGDLTRMPVKLFNTTDRVLRTEVELVVEGPITAIREDGSEPISVPPGANRSIWFKVRALSEGEAGMTVIARAAGLPPEEGLVRRHATFTVRRATPLHSEAKVLALPVGGNRTIMLPEVFGADPKLLVRGTVGGRPSVRLAPAFEEVIGYPHGCLEQTTSRLWALLWAPRILEVRGKRAELMESLIRKGIDRLAAMQTSWGGLAYWPGETSPSPWGSAYAADFMAAARDAGYAPDEDVLRDLLEYLDAFLGREDGNYRGEQGRNDNLRAQIACVLSRHGRAPRGWMTRLLERRDDLDGVGRAWLARAWIFAGRKDHALSLIEQDLVAAGTFDTVSVATGGRITSPVHHMALLLNAALDIDPQHPAIPSLVSRIDASRTRGRWGTTLDNASALVALGRYAQAEEEPGSFRGTLTLGQAGTTLFDHETIRHFEFNGVGGPITVTSEGSGMIYLALILEGRTADEGIEAYDRRMTVRRTWRDPSGNSVNPTELKVGDLVLVDLKLEGDLKPGVRLDNVAVVDPLPGGMEVENPHFTVSAGDPYPNGALPERVEFLDDRVVLFDHLTRRGRTYRYALRVTSPGVFELPPVQASCMYDPSFASIHGRGSLKVRP